MFSDSQLGNKETHVAYVSNGCSNPSQGERRIRASSQNVGKASFFPTKLTTREYSSSSHDIDYTCGVFFFSSITGDLLQEQSRGSKTIRTITIRLSLFLLIFFICGLPCKSMWTI